MGFIIAYLFIGLMFAYMADADGIEGVATFLLWPLLVAILIIALGIVLLQGIGEFVAWLIEKTMKL